ncbi:MAG: VOC family protein, partial [Pseudomonadota bacterium]
MAGRVIGVGGVFLKMPDRSKTSHWYQTVLGLEPNDYEGFDFKHADTAASFPQAARTVFALFNDDADYFAPSEAPYMINLIVDDLDAVLRRASAAGVEPVQPSEDHVYGRFAWIL